MTTIKGFTSLEQSKKLAEILPLESADMKILSFGIDIKRRVVPIDDIAVLNKEDEIPCWSLAALISIIPQEIFDGEYIINITEGRDNRWVLTYDYFEDRTSSYYGLSTGADNLVDACTDIIIKLKERNII